MAKISLTEYAKKNKISERAARRKAGEGFYKTAEKIGRNWTIDENEPNDDNRIKSGKYINWRKK